MSGDDRQDDAQAASEGGVGDREDGVRPLGSTAPDLPDTGPVGGVVEGSVAGGGAAQGAGLGAGVASAGPAAPSSVTRPTVTGTAPDRPGRPLEVDDRAGKPAVAEPVVGERPPGQSAGEGVVGESALKKPALPETATVVVSVESLRVRSGVGVFRLAARSPNTLLAYRQDWDRFAGWCSRHGVSALPAEAGVVASYLAEAANTTDVRGRSAPWAYSPATLQRWLATINKAHDLSGLRAPGKDAEVKDTLAGLRRVRATRPARKTPLLLADLERIVEGIEATAWPAAPGGIRNRCLLVMGWVGAFRRDELVNLTVNDVTLHPDDGLHVLVRQSKTDQQASGRTYGLPCARHSLLCAPCAFVRWRNVVNAWEGADGGPGGRSGVMRITRSDDPDRHVCRDPALPAPGGDRSERLFRAVRANGTLGGPINGHAINAIVKRSAEAVGYDSERIGGHSLRAGFVTQAFRSGATAHAIMRQTGHSDPKTLEVYARETAPLVGNAVTQLGL